MGLFISPEPRSEVPLVCRCCSRWQAVAWQGGSCLQLWTNWNQASYNWSAVGMAGFTCLKFVVQHVWTPIIYAGFINSWHPKTNQCSYSIISSLPSNIGFLKVHYRLVFLQKSFGLPKILCDFLRLTLPLFLGPMFRKYSMRRVRLRNGGPILSDVLLNTCSINQITCGRFIWSETSVF